MPLAALFILFEAIVYDPTSPESKGNLFFLDMAAGYFSRLEYDSGGSVPSSIFSEFTFLARKFIREEQNTSRSVGPELTNVRTEINGPSFQVPPADIVCILTSSHHRSFITEADKILCNSSWPRLYINRTVVARSTIQIVPSPKVDIVLLGTIRLLLTLWIYSILCY